MNNLKRVLSLALSGIMLVGMMAVGASAADFKDADEIVNTDAVDTMVALNIINGKDDGSFDPKATVTRAEMAKMITVALNGGKDPVLGTSATPKFSDIKGHWAEKYIEYCANLSIINGRGDGTFDPGATVTGTEAAKMMLVAMGYDSTVFKFTGPDWAMNVNIEANNTKPNKLYAEIESVDPTQGLSRDNAAQLIFNGIQDQIMEKSPSMTITNGEISYDYELKNTSILGNKYGAKIEYGYLTSADLDDDKGEYTYGLSASREFGGDAVTTDGVSVASLTTTEDYTDLYGHKVKVIYKDNKTKDVLGIYVSESAVLASGVIDDLPTGSSALTGADKSFKFDGVTYRFDGNTAGTASGVKFYEVLNGQMTGKDLTSFAGIPVEYAIELIDNDDDGQVNCVMVYPFSVAKVSYVGKDSFNTAANTAMGVAAATGIKFDDVNFYDGLAKDDYVKVIPGDNCANSKDTYEKIEDDAVVEGKVTATRSGSVQVNDAWYSHSAADGTYALSSTYKMVVVNGYVCAAETVSNGAEIGDYAVVTRAIASANNGFNGDQAELLFTDGTKKIVDTSADYKTGTDFTGKLVTYKIEDGEYTLTDTASIALADCGFDKIITGNYDYVSGGKSTIGGEVIADDAVIFTKTATTNKFKVVTGADVKKYMDDATGIASGNVTKAFGNKTSATGYYNVALAYVTVADTVTAATENYGYVTSGLTTKKNADNKTVSVLSFWTADGQVTDAEATDRLTNVAKGSVITYDVDSKGIYTIKLATVNRAAIIGYNEKTGKIRFTDATLDSDGTNVDLDITKDTVILGINSDSKSGVEGPEIALAVETSTETVYQANAYWFSSNGTEADVIVVDTYANLGAMPGNVSISSTDATTANVQTALDNMKNVTLDASAAGATITANVPKGTTLTISDTHATNAVTVNAVDGATVEITDGSIADGMLVVNAAAGATVKVPNGTLLGSGAALSSTGSVTLTTSGTGGLTFAASAGVVTVNSNVAFGAKDTVNIASGAKIVGAKLGVEMDIDTATTVTALTGDFYSDAGTKDTTNATTASAAANKVYVWSTVFIGTDGDTEAKGWVEKA